MIGIRKEDKNEWERRAPLVPDQVRELSAGDDAPDFVVQPSENRVFDDGDYAEAGARIDEQLDGCRVILGIKEIPLERLEREKTYVCFSHTIKGQDYNMPMLRRMLQLNCTLVDYERITDSEGRRLIGFGRHAGYAGMIDGLWALGQRLAIEGHPTPFATIEPAHTYSSLDDARAAVSRAGREIERDGLPDALRPLIFGVTGTGNVSGGAIEILDLLPLVDRTPASLLDGSLPPNADRALPERAVFDLAERFRHREGRAVALDELSQHPENFDNGMLPWLEQLTVLVNGMYWVEALPRLLSLDDMRAGRATGRFARLKLIADISCDIDGAIEATVRATTPDNPVFVYDVERGAAVDGFVGDGPVILAVDNLPAELPREASRDFGASLAPLVPALARCDWSRPFEELGLPDELSRAVIAHRGRLTAGFSYLEDKLEQGADS